jgi:hypothetical protein
MTENPPFTALKIPEEDTAKECPFCHYTNVTDENIYVCPTCGAESCCDCGERCGCDQEDTS